MGGLLGKLIDDAGAHAAIPFAADPVSAPRTITPGALYLVAEAVTLTLVPTDDNNQNRRLGIKLSGDADVTGEARVTVPASHSIECDDGEFRTTAAIAYAPGLYREWICDALSRWILINKSL